MPELEAALRALGPQVEFPPTPDLTAAVRARLERPPWWRRPIAIALAVVLVVIGAILAVPPARTAVLDWLGLREVSIVRVDKLPPARAFSPLELGRPVSLEEARARDPWLVVPQDRPDGVYLKGREATLLWGSPRRVRLLLSEFQGRAYIEKLVESDTAPVPVRVGRDEGVWVEGRHVVVFRDPNGNVDEDASRLAANTLLWQHGDLILRLEGDLSKAEALRIARTVR